MADKALPLVSGKQTVAALKRIGFREAHSKSKGNDHAYVRERYGRKWITVVPIAAKQIPKGTLKSILRLGNIRVAEFKNALR